MPLNAFRNHDDWQAMTQAADSFAITLSDVLNSHEGGQALANDTLQALAAIVVSELRAIASDRMGSALFGRQVSQQGGMEGGSIISSLCSRDAPLMLTVGCHAPSDPASRCEIDVTVLRRTSDPSHEYQDLLPHFGVSYPVVNSAEVPALLRREAAYAIRSGLRDPRLSKQLGLLLDQLGA